MSRFRQRRRFLRQSLAAATSIASGYFVGGAPAAESTSPSERLDLAILGTGNQGWHNVEQLAGQNFVALCDVDARFLAKASAHYPAARPYRDYRRLLDAEQNKIDAVVIATPDHVHAPATSAALDLGKHVYCEKPLAHTVAEARALASLARRKKVATQMGTQIHGGDNYRRTVELIHSGAIGEVREVYHWHNSGRSGAPPAPWDGPPPAHLDWDLWLGPAKPRTYSPGVHPVGWRYSWQYGGGTFGDIACHVMDLSFWSLGLKHPTAVACDGPPVDPISTPQWAKATYDFPAAGQRGAVRLHWAHGREHFDTVKATKDHAGKPLSSWGKGVLFVGDKGMLAADYTKRQLLPKEKFADFQPPQPTIVDSPGHWNEWLTACKTGSPTLCHFDYAGPLTETVLLGLVAYRTGQRLEWDFTNLKATNTRAAEQ